MNEQAFRMLVALIVVGTHVLAPVYILFLGGIKDTFEVRAEISLLFAPITAVYASTITAFAIQNRSKSTTTKPVNGLFVVVSSVVVIGFAALYWLILYQYNVGGLDTTSGSATVALSNLKLSIMVIEIFYGSLFAIIINGLFKGTEG